MLSSYRVIYHSIRRTASVTQCDLSDRLFCIHRGGNSVNFKAMRYELTSFNRILAEKSRRVILALLMFV